MECGAVIVGAGRGERLGHLLRKAMVPLGGVPLITRSAIALAASASVREIVLVIHPDDRATLLEGESGETLTRCRVRELVAGGARRQDSVLAGLRALDPGLRGALVHDAARPFVSAGTVDALAAALDANICAVPVVPLASTLKRVRKDGIVDATVPRHDIFAAQTPQAARRAELIEALVGTLQRGLDVTDDVQAMELAGHKVATVIDSPRNFKITTPEDLELAEWYMSKESPQGRSGVRVGTGWDIHRFVEGRPLMLGGVEIPHDRGLLGHSDADAVLHAVTDAILGGAAMGDIGEMFPDTDSRWKGADSSKLLGAANERVRSAGFIVEQVDLTIITERPKLKDHKESIAVNVARLLGLPRDAVNVKAKTKEGLDAVGERQALEVHCVAVLSR